MSWSCGVGVGLEQASDSLWDVSPHPHCRLWWASASAATVSLCFAYPLSKIPALWCRFVGRGHRHGIPFTTLQNFWVSLPLFLWSPGEGGFSLMGKTMASLEKVWNDLPFGSALWILGLRQLQLSLHVASNARREERNQGPEAFSNSQLGMWAGFQNNKPCTLLENKSFQQERRFWLPVSDDLWSTARRKNHFKNIERLLTRAPSTGENINTRFIWGSESCGIIQRQGQHCLHFRIDSYSLSLPSAAAAAAVTMGSFKCQDDSLTALGIEAWSTHGMGNKSGMPGSQDWERHAQRGWLTWVVELGYRTHLTKECT